MLKKRVIPVLLLNDGGLVKTVGFDLTHARSAGDPVKSVSVYDSQLADEIILLHVARARRGWRHLAPLLEEISAVCFTPLTIGGGITSFPEAAFLIEHGADKVVVNTAAYSDKGLLTSIADRFGVQCVVVGIDARYVRHTDSYALFAECGSRQVPASLEDHIEACTSAGAGEYFVQSIDADGTMSGFDIRLLSRAMRATSAPVIGCGGSGNYDHLRDAFVTTGIGALACGSLFNFSDSNPIRARAFLSNYGLPVRKA